MNSPSPFLTLLGYILLGIGALQIAIALRRAYESTVGNWKARRRR